MQYLNQLLYPHVPYRTNSSNDSVSEKDKIKNVKEVGCGLCCACMVVNSLTIYKLDIEDCVKISEESKASPMNGTNMSILAPVIAEKYELEYKATDDVYEAVAHLQRGGHIIAHMGIPEGKDIGLFTKSGHYITLLSTDGKEFCILDPEYNETKFEIPERKGKVDTSQAPYLYCDINILNSETKPGRVHYHMFSRKR